MNEEEKKTDQTPEPEPADSASAGVTRRQFLIGAGTGLVVGAVGAAGVINLTATKPAQQASTTQPAQPTASAAAQPALPGQSAQPGQPVASSLVDGAKLVSLNINGRDYTVAVAPQTTLIEVLKRDLGLTGAKLGCNGSMCSACTVLVDGVAQNSCSLLAIRESGKKITTIEGLEQGGKLHPVQTAFWENMGYQCGFCTPGQIMRAVELLSKNKTPTDDQIRTHMSGNMCKCSAYPNILKSVQAAAKAMA